VRPSGACAVSLLAASSPGFGSDPADFCGLPAPTNLRLAGEVNLLAHYAKGTLSPRLQLLWLTWGFGPVATQPTAPLPSRYSALPASEVMSLGARSPHLQPGYWPTSYLGVLPRLSRLCIGPHVVDRRFLQQQVPLPLPCVNFAQIARSVIPAPARRTPDRDRSYQTPLSERDGRCVQSLISLHRDQLMHDY